MSVASSKSCTMNSQAIAQQQRLQERRQRNPSSSNEAGGSSGQASGSQATHAKLAGDTPSLASYEPPSWGGVPEGYVFSCNTMYSLSFLYRCSNVCKHIIIACLLLLLSANFQHRDFSFERGMCVREVCSEIEQLQFELKLILKPSVKVSCPRALTHAEVQW